MPGNFRNRAKTTKAPFSRTAILLCSLTLASAAHAQVGAEDNQSQTASGDKVESEDVILVTANYREQDLQEVPSAIQVFGGEDLDRLGAKGFEDYILSVPGASFRDQGSGIKRVSIRGISNVSANDFGAPTSLNTVGFYLNDVPLQGTNSLPDLSLFDLDRVEVLKGPQGTLYGDGAMGGAIKMILQKPDLHAGISGKAAITTSYTEDGGVNFNTNAALNIPLIDDRLAVRVVGSLRQEAGFIDNIATGENNVNSGDGYSVRSYVLADISDRLTAEALLYRDVSKVDEATQINIDLGDLEYDGLEDRFTDFEVNLYALTLKLDAGFAEITSVTSKYERTRDQVDRSDFGLPPVPLPRAPYTFAEDNDTFVQELRIISKGDNRLDWVFGGIYRNKERFSDFALTVDERDLELLPTDFRAGLFNGTEYQSQDILEKYKQFAVYGQLNFEISDRLEAIAGARWYNDKNSLDLMQIPGSLFVFAPLAIDTDDSGVLLKFGLYYEVSDDVLLFANAGQGYRPSAPNSNADFIGPDFASPGSLWNYEIGAKTSFADGRVTLNAAGYYTDWSNFQALVTEFSPLFGFELGFLDNGGDAEVFGVEIELAAAPTDQLTIGGTVGYTHSEVVEGIGGFTTGAPLPNTPEWTFNAFGEFRAPVSSRFDAYIRADVSYVDEQVTLAFTDNQTTGVMVDSYATGNLRFGLDTDDGRGVDLFVNNIWNERAQLGRGLAGNGNNLDSNRFTISRPRTFGVTVRGEF